jgi:HD-GYP domain-containing protein (c-di-GMP phosphodiesterase class II)
VIRDIFRNLEDPVFLKTAEEIATSHHEKWNGKGYPYGLKGEEIPLAARIMAAADVYDALVSPRVYKEPITPEEALAIIEGDSGAHFDPDVVRAMAAIREELIAEAKRPIQAAAD